jgi:hypothetical protein
MRCSLAQAVLVAALVWAAAALASSALLLLSRRPKALRPPAPPEAPPALIARLALLEADNARLRVLMQPLRLYCLVPASRTFAPERLRVVASTWGARCDVIKFFVERAPAELLLPDAERDAQLRQLGQLVQLVQLDGCTAEACRESMWTWLRDHDLDKADFFLAARDLETWLFPDFVRARLREMGWPARQALVLPLGAHGAGASRAALRRASHVIWPVLINLDAAKTPVDAHGLSAVALEPLTDALLAAPRAHHPRCCSSRPLAFHWRGIEQHQARLHSLLFNGSDATVEHLYWSRAEIDRPELEMVTPLFATRQPGTAQNGDEGVPRWRAHAELRYLMRVKGSLQDLGVALPRRRAVREADNADRLAETEQWIAESALLRLLGESGDAVEPDYSGARDFLGILRAATANRSALRSAVDATPKPASERSDDTTRALQRAFAAVAASRHLTEIEAAFLRGEPIGHLLLHATSSSV